MGKENESKKTVEIPVEAHYLEEVVPPKCRKARVRENVFLANAEFECLTEEEAPVALIVKHYNSHHSEETDELAYECSEKLYRLANGKLYTPHAIVCDTDRLYFGFGKYAERYDLYVLHQEDELFVPKDISKNLPAFDDSYAANTHASHECMMEKFLDMQRDFIMVGDELWRETLEPAYYIVGGGWGDSSWAAVKIAYQPKGEREYAYNAAEWDKVTEKTQKNSSRKLDFAHEDKIEVLIPEAVALPSSSEKRAMGELGSALKRLDDVQQDMDVLYDQEAHPVPDSIYDARCAVMHELAVLLDELAPRELRGCGDPESIEKIDREIYSEIDQFDIEERLLGYGVK